MADLTTRADAIRHCATRESGLHHRTDLSADVIEALCLQTLSLLWSAEILLDHFDRDERN